MSYIIPTHDVFGLEGRIKVRVYTTGVDQTEMAGANAFTVNAVGADGTRAARTLTLNRYPSTIRSSMWVTLKDHGVPTAEPDINEKTVMQEGEFLCHVTVNGNAPGSSTLNLFKDDATWSVYGNGSFSVEIVDPRQEITSVSFKAANNFTAGAVDSFRGVRAISKNVSISDASQPVVVDIAAPIKKPEVPAHVATIVAPHVRTSGIHFYADAEAAGVNLFALATDYKPESSLFAVYINGKATEQDMYSLTFKKGDRVLIKSIDDVTKFPWFNVNGSTTSLQTPVALIKEFVEPLPIMYKSNDALVDDFSYMFAGSKFVTVDADLLRNNKAVTKFDHAFENCASLGLVPELLFAYNADATSFNSCFKGCTALSNVVPNAFKFCRAVTDVASCFENCQSLLFNLVIPAEGITKADNFARGCRSGCVVHVVPDSTTATTFNAAVNANVGVMDGKNLKLKSGRILSRHESNLGSVLKFKAHGVAKTLFIPDAKYRGTAEWYTGGTTTASLSTPSGIDSRTTVGSSQDRATSVLSYHSTDKDLDGKFAATKNDGTAQQNTAALIGDTKCAAARFCANLSVGDVGTMQLPNIYELIVLYLESDYIDSLDPTVKDFAAKALGTKNPHGRFNIDGKGGYVWSSSEPVNPSENAKYANVVSGTGTVWFNDKKSAMGVVPVLEM